MFVYLVSTAVQNTQQTEHCTSPRLYKNEVEQCFGCLLFYSWRSLLLLLMIMFTFSASNVIWSDLKRSAVNCRRNNKDWGMFSSMSGGL